MTPDTLALQPDACYLALKARDARFDGSFFTGVTSTGIYCRPVCKVRTPKRENCRFFGLAAQAESAGFRPCLRCRPELAPGSLVWSTQDASRILALQAARLLDEPDAWSAEPPSVAALAQRLGVSDRHLRRLFEAQLGVTPLQYLQTRRLLTAKQLLADTALPVAEVALASGFASVRRFNAAFAAHYGLNPTAVRRTHSLRPAQPANSVTTVRLAFRPPYDIEAMLGFFRQRQLGGVEWVSAPGEPPTWGRTIALASGGQRWAGWVMARFDAAQHAVVADVADTLRPVLPQVIRRLRATLDLDADPQAIHAVLHPAFPHGEGLRVPGCMDGFELAVRAVLGQQITVAAARTLTQRLVAAGGEPLDTPCPELNRLFPSATTLLRLGASALGELGIVRQRQAAILGLADAVAHGALTLHGGAPVHETVNALKRLPGIGDWTAQYIAMRALRWPDAFPAADVALHAALHIPKGRTAARDAEARATAWKPWRSYAVIRAWAAGTSTPASPSKDQPT
jgi:AraC family transcriptional regulator of adaptative response / DNA-3-methyladenine glycosylase II